MKSFRTNAICLLQTLKNSMESFLKFEDIFFELKILPTHLVFGDCSVYLANQCQCPSWRSPRWVASSLSSTLQSYNGTTHNPTQTKVPTFIWNPTPGSQTNRHCSNIKRCHFHHDQSVHVRWCTNFVCMIGSSWSRPFHHCFTHHTVFLDQIWMLAAK